MGQIRKELSPHLGLCLCAVHNLHTHLLNVSSASFCFFFKQMRGLSLREAADLPAQGHTTN